ncbi:MAG TPA: tripartite tricarboxylate transporter substrate-binding protein [Alphaproteobacteria bacterium]|nr:tripartite tricarboxylate transporter substrate-binding protein [Alphaproteobacteria bacterium]
MRMTRRVTTSLILGFAFAGAAWTPAAAETAEEFYKNKKEMFMVVGSAPGGGYDGYARMLGRYMSKYLPGHPNIVVNNMPGAGGVRAANYVANVAPKDGSVISIMDRGLPSAPLLYGDQSNTQFDSSKMNWLGSASSESGMAVFGAKSPAKTLQDAMKVEMVLGSTGAEGDTAMMPRMLNEMFGTKFKLITAYKGQPEVVQAVQKGELDGLFMSGWSGQTRELLLQMFERKEVGFMVQMGFKRDPAVGDVPTIMELITNDDDKKVMEVILGRLELGRPFVAPPGVPADRVALLRKAFSDACADPELVLEGDKTRRYIEPIDGETTQKMIEAIYKTSPEVIAKIRTYVKPPAAQ